MYRAAVGGIRRVVRDVQSESVNRIFKHVGRIDIGHGIEIFGHVAHDSRICPSLKAIFDHKEHVEAVARGIRILNVIVISIGNGRNGRMLNLDIVLRPIRFVEFVYHCGINRQFRLVAVSTKYDIIA